MAAVLGAKERKDGCLYGNGWIVSWCVGHLVELAAVGAYDERFAKWRLEDLPILPDDDGGRVNFKPDFDGRNNS